MRLFVRVCVVLIVVVGSGNIASITTNTLRGHPHEPEDHASTTEAPVFVLRTFAHRSPYRGQAPRIQTALRAYRYQERHTAMRQTGGTMTVGRKTNVEPVPPPQFAAVEMDPEPDPSVGSDPLACHVVLLDPPPDHEGEVCHEQWIDAVRQTGGLASKRIAVGVLQAELHIPDLLKRFSEGEIDDRITIVFQPRVGITDDTRGIAWTSQRRITIFLNRGESYSDRSLLRLLLHEVAHQIQYDYYDKDVHTRSDLILLEGMATWMVGDQWVGERDRSLHHAACRTWSRINPDGHLGIDELGDLPNSYPVYTVWAGFVGYLIETYGWDTVHALYRSGGGRVAGGAAYTRITEKSLAKLTRDWRTWCRSIIHNR